LRSLHDENRLQSATLIGVIKEVAPTADARDDAELGVKNFQDIYFPFPLYLDSERKFYDAILGNRQLSLGWNPINWVRWYLQFKDRINSKNITGNYKGEGFQLGGVLVISKDKGIVYQYEEVTGSELPVDEVADAVRKL
jgi:hypothetical protein